jgi:hypothetical protein
LRRQFRSILDRGAHEEMMELISTRHFDKFSVWNQKSFGNLKISIAEMQIFMAEMQIFMAEMQIFITEMQSCITEIQSCIT